MTSSALQSRKWQLIGMSQWCCSALCGHPLPALMDNWTHGAASRHTIAPISHTRPSPRSRSYYSFPVPLRVGGWVGKPRLAGYTLNFPFSFCLRLHILLGQIKSFHNLLNTIPPSCLPQTSPSFTSFQFHHCAMFNPVSIILTFYVSKPSQSTSLNHQTDWFQAQQASLNAVFFFLCSKVNPHIHLIMLVSVLCNFTFHFNWPGLAADQHTSLPYDTDMEQTATPPSPNLCWALSSTNSKPVCSSTDPQFTGRIARTTGSTYDRQVSCWTTFILIRYNKMAAILLLLVCVSWTITGQPRNSVFIRRV